MGANLDITSLCNMALDLLEEAPINDINDDLTVPRWFRRNFWPTAHALIRMHPWNFAKKRTSLPLGSAPAFGWRYGYLLPSDCLRLLPVTCNGEEGSTEVAYKIEGQSVYCNRGAPLLVRYLWRVDNTSLFDNQFCEALAASLAAKAAHFITGKQSYGDRMKQTYQELLLLAQTMNALEGTPDDPIDDFWIRARQ